ncbi:sensor histidine kinase [Pontibacter cellulosilyticus]|uniref:Histidine kinase n=1 Tax=Pontibacter cellulosilyticus TaxID=1720253 RepID=A0A923SKI0_9BACT|nr:histidine kinase [Pontibacter cellulosilyticus]MBC5994959.1 histidine kinase [Pontibacter cellulosilyticus]
MTRADTSHTPMYKQIIAMVLLAVLIQLWFSLGSTSTWTRFLHNTAYNFSLILPIWLGNKFIAERLNRHISWLQEPGKRLVMSVMAMLIFSTVIFLLINFVVFVLIKGNDSSIVTSKGFKNMMLFQVGITAVITFIMYSLSFFHNWRNLAVNEEKLKREQLNAQYESLKAQVNPHFLFNSLNALTSLVETDQKLAVKFIRKLSEVYRYVLESRQKEVVPLTEELAFLDSYIYLQKIRHGEALQVENKLPQSSNLMVPPLALQMLLENAIKHNVALDEEPLNVCLYLQDDYLVVQNNVQERRIREESTGTGLANIEERYNYLTTKQVQVQRTGQEFIVKLPILYFKDDAGTDS